MMNKNLFAIILLFYVATSAKSSIFEGSGETVFPFLKINPSVNSAAVSGGNSVTLNGIQSLYLNPAGTAQLEATELYAQYCIWFDDIQIGYMSTGINTGLGVLGLSAGYMMYPDQKETVADSQSPYNYRETGSFNASAGFFGSYLSRRLGKKLYGGVGLKYIGQRIGGYASASTCAFDVGIMAETSPYAIYGISVNNISWGAKYGSSYEKLPLILRIGGEWKYHPNRYWKYDPGRFYSWQYSLKICCEMRANEGLYINSGVEILPLEFLPLRIGYSYSMEENELGGLGGLSCGTCISGITGMDIEYALSSYGRLGLVHRLGIVFSL
ncbi:MAG: PorV/PorQ family protein [Elusimicrobiota bacterium]